MIQKWVKRWVKVLSDVSLTSIVIDVNALTAQFYGTQVENGEPRAWRSCPVHVKTSRKRKRIQTWVKQWVKVLSNVSLTHIVIDVNALTAKFYGAQVENGEPRAWRSCPISVKTSKKRKKA